jgi:hypothetical protein
VTGPHSVEGYTAALDSLHPVGQHPTVAALADAPPPSFSNINQHDEGPAS